MFERGLRFTIGGVEVDVPAGILAPGDVLAYNGTQIAGTFRGTGFNTATQVAAVTALANVTSHTFSLTRTGLYYFRFIGAYQTNATITGLVFGANLSTTPTSYTLNLSVETGATGNAEQYFSTNTPNAGIGATSGPGAVNQRFVCWGRVGISAPSTFAFRIASEVAVANGVTLALGAVSEVWQ